VEPPESTDDAGQRLHLLVEDMEGLRFAALGGKGHLGVQPVRLRAQHLLEVELVDAVAEVDEGLEIVERSAEELRACSVVPGRRGSAKEGDGAIEGRG
jgi:hypothetical protein